MAGYVSFELAGFVTHGYFNNISRIYTVYALIFAEFIFANSRGSRPLRKSMLANNYYKDTT